MHLEAIARLPAEYQGEIAGWDEYDLRETFDPGASARDLEDALLKHCCYLRTAAWKLDAAGPWGELNNNQVPPCSACTARTDCTPELFHEENDKTVKKNARCLLPACWQHKTKIHTSLHVDTLREQYGDALKFSGRYEAQQLGLDLPVQFYGKHSCGKEVKEGTRGAVPVLLLDDNQRVGWFKLENETDPGKDAGGPKSLETKLAELTLKRRAWCVAEVRKALNAPESSTGEAVVVPEKLFLPDGSDVTTTIANLVTLVCTFGMDDRHISDKFDDADAWNWLGKTWANPTDASDEIEKKLLWEGICSTLNKRMAIPLGRWQDCQSAFDEAVQIAVMLGYSNEADLMARAADALPEPKSWQKERAAQQTSADAGTPTASTGTACLAPAEAPPGMHPDLLEEAKAVLRATKRASLASLQRRMKLKPHQAAQVMDALEAAGIVGPPKGSEPREILVDLGE
jgi:hypothetical protein